MKPVQGPKAQLVYVAMSGGVDSSVTAALLKQEGHDVVGVHIKMWSPMESLRDSTGQADPFFGVCQQQNQDRMDAMKVAALLDIPFQTWDLTKEYRAAVVDYMVREYAGGRTPNPDIMCNRYIKFGVFFDRAISAGADFVATGHYARLCRADQNGQVGENGELEQLYQAKRFIKRSDLSVSSHQLLAAADASKDQSYFLWTLTQRELAKTLFPIGEYQKTEVRELAKKFGLSTAKKADSQGICFIGEIDIREFLKKYIPVERGRVLTTAGREIGEHEGLPFYTIGQRQGIGIGGGIPYYVTRKDFDSNTLVVAEGPYDTELFRKELVASGVQWTSDIAPAVPFSCSARIRYRQPLQVCDVVGMRTDGSNTEISVEFREPQRAVTAGQSIVLYNGPELIGGGVIQ